MNAMNAMHATKWWVLGGLAIGLAFEFQGQTQKPEPMSAVEAGTPGAPHQRLMKQAGEYTTATKFVGAGLPASDSKGAAKISAILGGRFLMEENSGTMAGQTASGVRLLGYNNATGQYEGVWAYTGSTALMTMTGASRDDGKTIECAASFDAGAGAKQSFRIVRREIDGDHFVVETHSKMADGTEGAVYETTYSRKP